MPERLNGRRFVEPRRDDHLSALDSAITYGFRRNRPRVLGLGCDAETLFASPANVVFSCELTWRGPCASTGRDKADRQLQNCVRRQATEVRTELALIFLGNQFSDSRNQLDRDVHLRVRSVFPSSFIFSYSFAIRLGLIVLKDAIHSSFVPTRWILRFAHFFFRDLRPRARLAFGPRS